MDSRRWAFLLSLMLLIACVLYIVVTYQDLPERVAVQFDFNNKPASWQSKSGFIKLYLGVLVGLNIVFLFFVNFLSKIPINVPWRDYWFSTPERKSEGIARMGTVLSYTLVFMNSVYLFVYHVVYQENTGNALFYVPVDIGVYFILFMTVVLLVGLFLYMKPPKKQEL